MPRLWHLEVSWATVYPMEQTKAHIRLAFYKRKLLRFLDLASSTLSLLVRLDRTQPGKQTRSCATQPPSFRSEREEHACKLLLHLPGPATRVIEISQAGSGRPCSGAGAHSNSTTFF